MGRDLKLSSLCLVLGLRIDENTAKYYLADAGGDLKKAIKLFGEHAILLLEDTP